jgi:hypothetical protein|tara:strand:+ start:219 stop:518 length:300 start_codon:yes stop_codon:yes gene_type:complete
MATLAEVQKELRSIKKEVRELRTHNKFLLDRLDLAHEKNAKLREEKNNMTVDDVVLMQKAKAEYASSIEKSISEQLSIQEKVQLDSAGLSNAQSIGKDK